MIDNLPVSPRQRYLLARKLYAKWRWRSKESKMLIATLFVLSGGICPECNRSMILTFDRKENERKNAATLDHVTPIVKVLEHNKYGMQIMCRSCNVKKGHSVD